MTPQQRRREQKIRQILDAGEQIVLKSGLDGLTIHALARALDYTPGALYRYFPSKQAIIAELNSRAVQGYHRLFESVAAASSETQVSSEKAATLLPLMASAEAFIRRSGREPGAFAMVSATAADPRDLLTDSEAVHIPHLVALLASLRGAIDGAVNSGAIQPGDSDKRAIALTFGLIGILQLRKLVRFSSALSPEPIARGLARDQLAGWGAPAYLIEELQPLSNAIVDAVLG